MRAAQNRLLESVAPADDHRVHVRVHVRDEAGGRGNPRRGVAVVIDVHRLREPARRRRRQVDERRVGAGQHVRHATFPGHGGRRCGQDRGEHRALKPCPMPQLSPGLRGFAHAAGTPVGIRWPPTAVRAPRCATLRAGRPRAMRCAQNSMHPMHSGRSEGPLAPTRKAMRRAPMGMRFVSQSRAMQRSGRETATRPRSTLDCAQRFDVLQ